MYEYRNISLIFGSKRSVNQSRGAVRETPNNNKEVKDTYIQKETYVHRNSDLHSNLKIMFCPKKIQNIPSFHTKRDVSIMIKTLSLSHTHTHEHIFTHRHTDTYTHTHAHTHQGLGS